MLWLPKWVSHHLACDNYRFPLWFFTCRLPQQPCSGSAESLSQGFKSEAAQPFPVHWRIFPLAPRHHGNLAMASLPPRWHPVLAFPASTGLKGCCCCSLCIFASLPFPVSSSAREVVVGCVLAVVLPASVRDLNQTKVILWWLYAWDICKPE